MVTAKVPRRDMLFSDHHHRTRAKVGAGVGEVGSNTLFSVATNLNRIARKQFVSIKNGKNGALHREVRQIDRQSRSFTSCCFMASGSH
jgi:hypothetical protein